MRLYFFNEYHETRSSCFAEIIADKKVTLIQIPIDKWFKVNKELCRHFKTTKRCNCGGATEVCSIITDNKGYAYEFVGVIRNKVIYKEIDLPMILQVSRRGDYNGGKSKNTANRPHNIQAVNR